MEKIGGRREFRDRTMHKVTLNFMVRSNYSQTKHILILDVKNVTMYNTMLLSFLLFFSGAGNSNEGVKFSYLNSKECSIINVG